MRELLATLSKLSVRTYVSKSISYNVSEKGREMGFHCCDAADAGAGAPKAPVVVAMAAAAATDPDYKISCLVTGLF